MAETMKITAAGALKGSITVPGDKSISHRSVMFGSIAKGITRIEGFLTGDDCLSTIRCFRQMGIDIEQKGTSVTVTGKGLRGLLQPEDILDVGNSGTTMRLMSGILSGQSFISELTGDASIQKRPMKRIIDPLSMMGANIKSLQGNGMAPLRIEPSNLKGIEYHSPVASAQVKSSILLAGLYAEGETRVFEPSLSRNHSEIMLKYFGADIISEGCRVTVKPAAELYANPIQVPGDISSAAFFLVAGLIVPDSEILLKNVGINPTRDGIIRVLKAMNGSIELLNEREMNGEPVADLLVKSSKLTATTVSGDIIPTLIDEIPVIAVAAAFAEGTTVIADAAELKVKESNRIDTMVDELGKLGAKITPTDDGMVIEGGHSLEGAVIESHHDHRVAMSLAIAGLAIGGTTTINNSDCIAISYPCFERDLKNLL